MFISKLLKKKTKRDIMVIGTIISALTMSLLAAVFIGIPAYKDAKEKNKAYDVKTLTIDEIRNANINNADKLMIVAHPDDETIWGGGHLQDGGYLVVCLTNGRNEKRKSEFIKAVNASNNTPLILEYPDKVCGERDDWTNIKGKIQEDINKLITYKNWKEIVTHNKDGEYGHIHHKMTHKFVYDACEKNSLLSELWVFGKYYSKDEIEDINESMDEIGEAKLKLKQNFLTFYKSQDSTIKKFDHIIKYEMWQKVE